MLADIERRQYLQQVAKDTGVRLFVETGTSEGQTTEQMLAVVDRVITIELLPDKYMHCVRKFINEPRVTLVHADSDVALEQIVQEVKEPALFWLDAHFNGPIAGHVVSPVYRELQHILYHRERCKNYILIDDARLFGQWDYPTLEHLENWVSGWPVKYSFNVKDDIIHILPEDS